MTPSAACAFGAASGVPPHYTGKERDIESGLDYFPARYYNSNMGRFMSPDWSKNPQGVPYADFTNPQTLNLSSTNPAAIRGREQQLIDANGGAQSQAAPRGTPSWGQPHKPK